MYIKKGDKVVVITGKDRGKSGVVAKAWPKDERVVIDGVNLVKRHERSKKQGSKGQVVSVAMPIHVSNVMLVDPKGNARTRVGKKLVGERFVRVAKKSGVEI